MQIGAQTRERVVQAITDNTDPTLYPAVEYMDLDGQTVIVVAVFRSEDRPHLVRGQAYKRVGAADASATLSTGVQMSRVEYERLLLARRQPPFDQQLVEGATYADLGEAKVQNFLRRRQEAYPDATPPGAPLPQVVVEMLEGARERNGGLAPTYTGLLFFGRDPQRFLPRAEVKLARFQGTTMLAFIDRLIVHGTLPEMLDEAERFIRRNTRTAMKVVEFESVQVSEYPYDAIREALVNAMAHRDYHHSSGIQVNIFDDRLEVMSPGEALIPLSELEGSHVTRNETLSRRFRDIGEMEQFGTGITKPVLSLSKG